MTDRPATPATPGERPPHRRLPAFVAGLLLGGLATGLVVGLVMGLGVGTGSGGGANPTPTIAAPAPTHTPSAAPTAITATVTVPVACVQAAERAQQAFGLVRDAVGAAQRLDARRLARIVDQLRALQREVDTLAARCRAATASPAPSS